MLGAIVGEGVGPLAHASTPNTIIVATTDRNWNFPTQWPELFGMAKYKS